jgi:hypothetical protein
MRCAFPPYTCYLKNGGKLGKATATANHASTRKAQLHDSRRDEVSRDKVEGFVIWARRVPKRGLEWQPASRDTM